ncbi:YaaC-like protein [Marinimicrobium koreense]|uniref:YaaC-like protein n=1 Tax=Marinimicrobium koreense TaxID=306545 RepID=A0A3N1NQB9_9GAMM|nr:YaaC family protein [Marinimicrobium koreense]ROQ21042.1 YaaC-like protein [Marinimicrobium koreense]
MAHRDIIINSKKVSPHKAYVGPKFNEKTILVESHFEFIEMWLQRNGNEDSRIYWDQAKNFYHAAANTDVTSKPLVAYYCMLNASKSLLALKGVGVSPYHGLAGSPAANKAMLVNELIEVKANGVFVALSNYFGASLAGKKVNLKDVLYNIPYIHRAFTTTHPGMQDLFIPISDPHFVRNMKSDESWFCATVRDSQYQKENIFKKQRGWEIDASEHGFVIRRNKRFSWSTKRGTSKSDRINELKDYHSKIRRDIKYIHSHQRLWYYKRNDRGGSVLPWPTPSLIYMGMHRLSELCRYEPSRLARHFKAQHNWLLTEFINHSLSNFVDQIACEICGLELMSPKIR